LGEECEVRGTDATGIAYPHNGRLSVYKRPVPARRLKVHLPDDCHIVMGHTRMTTQGTEKKNKNNHPFIGNVYNGSFALAHNGILWNDKTLRISEKLPGTTIQTDSYIAVQLIEQEGILDFASLKNMAEKIEGMFTFTLLDRKGNLYFIRGDNPLCIYHFKTFGFYLYASTEEIMKHAVIRMGLQNHPHEEVKIKGGDLLRIDAKGQLKWGCFDFDEFGMYGYCHRPRSLYHDSFSDKAYWDGLKTVAGYMGFSAADIDHYRDLGYPPDYVEEILYGFDMDNHTQSSYHDKAYL
jgi:asparagine synthetase B (glutamine-hydrolysing)